MISFTFLIWKLFPLLWTFLLLNLPIFSRQTLAIKPLALVDVPTLVCLTMKGEGAISQVHGAFLLIIIVLVALLLLWLLLLLLLLLFKAPSLAHNLHKSVSEEVNHNHQWGHDLYLKLQRAIGFGRLHGTDWRQNINIIWTWRLGRGGCQSQENSRNTWNKAKTHGTFAMTWKLCELSSYQIALS